MSSPSVANSTVTVMNAVSTETHITSTTFYNTIVIQNNSGQPIWVAVDGGTATVGGAHEMLVPTGVVMVFDNEQALPNSNETGNTWGAQTVKYNSGAMDTLPTGLAVVPAYPGAATPQHNQTQASAWTGQTAFNNASATASYCSFIPNAATSASNANTVTVTFQ